MSDVTNPADALRALREQLAHAQATVVQAESERRKAERAQQLAEFKAQALTFELSVVLRRLSELRAQLTRLQGGNQRAQLELEVQALEARLSDAQKEAYGASKSERRRKDPNRPKRPRTPQTGHGPTPQPLLPRDVVTNVLDEADRVCPCCGDVLHAMTGQADISELIIAAERTYRVQEHHNQKYSCRCGHIDTALGPETRLVRGGRYDLSFAVQVAVDKYLDHLPLERQVGRMAREGLVVTSQTLWDQLFALYLLLVPTLAVLLDECRRSNVLHIDETRFRKMGKTGSKKWWLWVTSGDTAVVFHLLPSRGSQAAKAVLGDFSGIVVSDGYKVYQSLAKLGGLANQSALDGSVEPIPQFIHAVCWAHARRPLFDAESHTDHVSDVLDLVDKLFEVERRAKSRAAAGEDLLDVRRQLRESESRPLIESIRQWIESQRPIPRSKHEGGVRYLQSYWPELTAFLGDPRIPIDNNAAERALRGPVVGRKNYYGVRSQRGAEVAAAFFSVFATCRLVGADPAKWLLAAAKAALKDRTAVLTPAQFAALT